MILDYSEKKNGDGRILHEVTTAGVCANPGNTQETAHFIAMLWMYFEWTGDFTLIEKALPYLKKSVAWLQAQDPEGEYFPGGYGIIEISGLDSKMLDTAVYTAEAYRCYALICKRTGDEETKTQYEELSQKTMDAINTRMWDEEQGLYCDAFTSVAEVLEKKDAILENRHNKNAKKAEDIVTRAIAQKEMQRSGKSGWLLNYNWIINTPMEMGIAPEDKAARALSKLHPSDYIGPYGMYLSGVYREAAMTISTGVMAVAQARYGYADRALELLERMFKSFGMSSPGCIAEMSPDYGCFVQAWTSYAAFVPIVRYFFGVQPEADGHQNRLVLRPCMPSLWDHASFHKAAVLDGQLDLSFSRKEGKCVYTGSFSGKTPLFFTLEPNTQAVIDGKEYQGENTRQLIELTSRHFEIQL